MTGSLKPIAGRRAVDVCVIGGGPAGAATAQRLCALGHSVALVDRPTPRQGVRFESITPSLGPLLGALGVASRIADIAHSLPRRRVRWTGDEEVADGGLLVDRTRFDDAMRDAAEAAGALSFRPANARAIAQRSGWIVEVDGRDGKLELAAEFVVQATGRQTIQHAAGVPTAALCGEWIGIGPEHMADMQVDAGPHAWYWAASLPTGSTAACVFLDVHRCAGLSLAEREALYRSMLRDSALLGVGCLGTLTGGVHVRDATCRLHPDPVTRNAIRVGDASFKMDPLSSQGLQHAIRSGLQAATVVHTIVRVGDVVAAVEFYRNAQQNAARQHRRAVARLYAGQTWHDTPFWRARAMAHSEGIEQGREERALGGQPRDVNWRLAAEVRITPVPVIDGDIVRRRPAVVHPALAQPVAWLGGTELAPMLGALVEPRSSASLLTDWSRNMPAGDARRLFDWLTGHGILVPDRASASDRPA